jgi:hypothetical protein
MISRQFYEKLGDFLLVLSKVDGVLHEKEERRLMDSIVDILKEHPGFEENSEVQGLLLTKLHFYNKEKEPVAVRNTTEEFLNFLEVNGRHISDLSKTIALRLIRDVAGAYKGTGRGEKRMIDQVVEKLQLAHKENDRV